MTSQTQAEKEVADMFANAMPALSAAKSARREDTQQGPVKFHKTGQQKGFRGKGFGGRRQQNATQSTENQPQMELTEETMMELLTILTRLSLKHEDIIAAYQADSCFMLYLDTAGDLSITASLYQVTQTWQLKKKESPETLTQSLRVTLLTALFMELRERMNMALQKDKRATLSKHSWISESDPATWNYQKWDPTTETAIADTGRTGLPHSEALTIIQRVLQLIPATVLIQKFHSTRPQAAGVSKQRVAFHVDDQQQGRTGPGTLWTLPAALRSQRDAADRIPTSSTSSAPPTPCADPGTGSIQPLADGRPDSSEPSEGRRSVRPWPAGPPASPVLLNPGQICYMNAAVILLHWLVQVASRDLPSPYGVLQAAFGSLKAGLKLTLTSSLPWHAPYARLVARGGIRHTCAAGCSSFH